MTGHDSFVAAGQKIKSEVKARQEKERAETLAVVKQDKDLAQMYRDSAALGSKNLSGTMPMLKVHSTGRSTKNELADGGEPTNGWFFYTEDATQYQEVICHILSVSAGFRSPGMGEQEGKMIFNQLMGGVIMDENTPKPFLMYMTGKKLQPLWDFGKEAAKFTHSKEMPIPMFALTVKLTTRQEKNKFGKSWVVNFEIVRNENNGPKVVTDEGLFVFLKDHVGIVEESMERIISARSGEDTYSPADEPPHPAELPSGEVTDVGEPH